METNERTAPVSKQPDQNTISLDLMSRMKMHGMAEAFRESFAGTTAQSMTPDTFLSMLLSREWDYRAQAAVARMTKNAAFRYRAYLEEIDYTVNRGLERNQMERLATLDFVSKGRNLFITGSSGTGKSFLTCALGHEACKKGIRTLYANAAKLLGPLKVAKVRNNPRLFHLKIVGFFNLPDLQPFYSCPIIPLFFLRRLNIKSFEKVALVINFLENRYCYLFLNERAVGTTSMPR